jgi:predicted phosphodiesterase
MRKNWQASLQHKADAIIFLGDMMDSGRYIMSDEELVSDFRYQYRQFF